MLFARFRELVFSFCFLFFSIFFYMGCEAREKARRAQFVPTICLDFVSRTFRVFVDSLFESFGKFSKSFGNSFSEDIS